MPLKGKLRQIPIIRLLIPYLAGIIFQIYFQFSIDLIIVIFLFFIIVILVTNSIKAFSQTFRRRWTFGFLLITIMFIVGVINTRLVYKPPISEHLNKKDFYRAIILKPIEEKTNSFQATAQIFKKNKKLGKAIIYFKKDSLSEKINMGDNIIFHSTLSEINNSNNPDEFDYKKYLSFHNIFMQTYVNSNGWKLINIKGRKNILIFPQQVRNKLLKILFKYGVKDKEYQIASAIILGYKNGLSSEIKQSYAASGAMHILAVSGLHVGIIYLVFSYLLRALIRTKKFQWINTLLLILIIWFYAIITGLSPSIQRAAIMFSFIIIGYSLKRPVNIYNSIFLSAFLLLLINPYIITEIGFQLSYLAVLGIVTLYPKIYGLWPMKLYLFDKIWALVSVSVSAQIATLPVTLYYFHQFPIFFILTNVIVVPLVTIILYLGIALFMFSFWPWLALSLGASLSFIIKLLNTIVINVESFRFSIIENIYFTKPHIILFYAFIIFTFLFIYYKKSTYLKSSLFILLIILGFSLYNNYQIKIQNKFYVYNIHGQSVYNYIKGQKSYVFYGKNYSISNSNFNYAIRKNILLSGIRNKNIKYIDFDSISNMHENIMYYYLTSESRVIAFDNIKVLVICGNEKDLDILKLEIQPDFIILCSNAYINFEKIKGKLNNSTLIFDSSNSYSTINKWIQECYSYNIPFYSVPHKGAFQFTL